MEFDQSWVDQIPETASGHWRGMYSSLWNQRTRNDLSSLGEGLLKSWYWTIRLSESVPQNGIEPRPPGFQWSAVGLVLPNESDIGRFGVIQYIDARVTQNDSPSEREPIVLEGNAFPVIERRIKVTLQQGRSIRVPREGSVSRARTRVGKDDQREGWLTAAHVVAGCSTVEYEDGSIGSVTDLAPGCIDAALISDQSLSPSTRTLSILQAVTAGIECSFTGLSGTYMGHVTDVTTSLGVLTASALPVRIGLSQYGIADENHGISPDAIIEIPHPVRAVVGH
jgi:hypothetical protein